METMQVFHMNKGNGETSYAKNSTVQSKIISVAKSVMDEAILEMLCTRKMPQSIGIADLGCSSGPNALRVISETLDVIYTRYQDLGRAIPEFRVFLNDLPCNDFNCIFGLLPELYNKLKEEKGAGFGSCFISGTPGSFYGRLFPSKSLHCVHSSSSLHWLSQVPTGLERYVSNPVNKGKIYISKSSPSFVLEAYSKQYQKDFSMFLKSRSEELVPGGCMVLSFMGRRSSDPTTEESCYHWELLAKALMSMVSEGKIKEEKVDSFNAPYYAPCAEEMKLEVQKEGSFIIDRLEAFEIDWDGGSNDGHVTTAALTRGQRVSKTIRAVVESMLETHFGSHIMDELFKRFGELVDDYLSKNRTKYVNLVISLLRKEQ
ncbi:probable jasmonic acid carboxyl methyltransferase 2 [Ricinus communis]|uniref:Jasmonate O-methyltransferase, putative n=1 Tax=Ricinus communis TaxID=3988 RepID=B9R7Y1_RICCO|nr:probable jasmonic acid carboxyl methyltransferase 2 [Ricinus communis]EEF52611.1 Jasmonate O-methyltransferase, putative [Ricinus communis]|eukprot:XP_002510424.1 jasmonate O-methyltransferase [Ricinus communis]